MSSKTVKISLNIESRRPSKTVKTPTSMPPKRTSSMSSSFPTPTWVRPQVLPLVRPPIQRQPHAVRLEPCREPVGRVEEEGSETIQIIEHFAMVIGQRLAITVAKKKKKKVLHKPKIIC
jgi:hypothetical protein